MSIAALLATALLVAAPAAELTGIAVLPADTYAGGPPSGAWDDSGARAAIPRFRAQPVQGISSIKPGPRAGTWWALSDNGYATRWNSFDYRLAIYLFALAPRVRGDDPRPPDRRRVRLERRITLRDPQRLFPWRLTEESLPGRPLTGADIDPESFVVLPDGTFWVSDEVGPWLLHFSARGVLLEPPHELRVTLGGPLVTLRSAVHPLVLAGKAPAQLRASKGFEGLALAADGHLLAMLEGAVPGDPPDLLRIFEFELAQRRYSGRSWGYRLDDPAHSIGELAADGGTRFLVIERDQFEGAAAKYKRIFRIDTASTLQDASAEPGQALPQPALLQPALLQPTLLQKEPCVNLLALRDPQRLAGGTESFTFPYWTTEAVQRLADGQLLVVNDNNFPATGGRGTTVRDPTEWIWLRIP